MEKSIKFTTAEISNRSTMVSIHSSNGTEMTYFEFATRLADREEGLFRDRLMETLNAFNFEAYFWEFAPFAPVDSSTPVKFVIVESKALANTRTDLWTFEDHIKEARKREQLSHTFMNLGKDAELIIPVPQTNEAASESCAHIGSFMEKAKYEVKHALLIRIGQLINDRISLEQERPLWISTSGLGVAYLHIRFDKRPKYYSYAPFTKF